MNTDTPSKPAALQYPTSAEDLAGWVIVIGIPILCGKLTDDPAGACEGLDGLVRLELAFEIVATRNLSFEAARNENGQSGHRLAGSLDFLKPYALLQFCEPVTLHVDLTGRGFIELETLGDFDRHHVLGLFKQIAAERQKIREQRSPIAVRRESML